MLRPQIGFNPAGLCYDPVTMTIAVVAMAGGQIYSGIQANKAAKEQASSMEDQARIAKEESDIQAEQKSTERRKFLAEQRMAYLSNGVSLEGTPMFVQEETWKEFQSEIEAIRRSGSAQYGFGMKEAATTRNSGRAALLSGIMSGVGTAAMGAHKSGMFSAKTTTAVK
jgi:flagellar biosynthesis component FlhA